MCARLGYSRAAIIRAVRVMRRVPVGPVPCRLKFLSAQITAIEGPVDDEIGSDPTLREKVKIITSVPGVGDSQSSTDRRARWRRSLRQAVWEE